MNALSLVLKFSVATTALSFASGAIEDVLVGTLDGISISAAYAQMGELHGKLMEYHALHKRYPLTQKELHAFLKMEFDTPLERLLVDPWKTSYYFLTNQYEILSFGPDGKRDTRDDIGYPYPESIRIPGKLD